MGFHDPCFEDIYLNKSASNTVWHTRKHVIFSETQTITAYLLRPPSVFTPVKERLRCTIPPSAGQSNFSFTDISPPPTTHTNKRNWLLVWVIAYNQSQHQNNALKGTQNMLGSWKLEKIRTNFCHCHICTCYPHICWTRSSSSRIYLIYQPSGYNFSDSHSILLNDKCPCLCSISPHPIIPLSSDILQFLNISQTQRPQTTTVAPKRH